MIINYPIRFCYSRYFVNLCVSSNLKIYFYSLSSNTSYKSLVIDLLLFLFLGGIIWTINFIGQTSFPGNKLFPFFIRSMILVFLVTLCYVVNYKFSKKNLLNNDFLKFKSGSIKHYVSALILAILLIATIWIIIYFFYPFRILINSSSKINIIIELISYSLGNTLEEFLFRGFLLLALIRLFGKTKGILFISLLFGIFHLQGSGLTGEGFNMLLTTFTMSLLFIAVIYYSKSIWTAVILHITGNFLLHTLGFDGSTNGIFQINFIHSNPNIYFIFLVFEIVVITFALLVFSKATRN